MKEISHYGPRVSLYGCGFISAGKTNYKMWKLPLEFDNIPPSRSGAQRRVRKKVKTPLIPRVKTSQHDTIPRRIWVGSNPSLDNKNY